MTDEPKVVVGSANSVVQAQNYNHFSAIDNYEQLCMLIPVVASLKC